MTNNMCEFYFWDVQHGHATYIRTPNGRHIVVDLGSGDYSRDDASFSPLCYIKNYMNVDQIDFLVITHPHLDHIDDILNLRDIEPKVLLRPKHLTKSEIMSGVQPKDKPKFDAYCDLSSRYGFSVGGDSVNETSYSGNWGGLNIQTFSPQNCSHSNFNNHSIISVFEFEGVKVVIPGDNERCSFDELMLQPSFKQAIRDADVLLAPHHGRESGYDKDFVSLVNPKITIVSDGRFCSTSANVRYSNNSSGWKTYYRGGREASVRKCLTTNSDGHVVVKIGRNATSNFLYVEAS